MLPVTTYITRITLLQPWSMLKIPSLWQFPMGELKAIIEHCLPSHGSSTILGIIMQYKCIHLNPRGWPVLVLIFKDMQNHYTLKLVAA
jgi:hypothetical protein